MNQSGLPPSMWAGGEQWILPDGTQVEPEGWKLDPRTFVIDLAARAVDDFLIESVALHFPRVAHRIFTGLRVSWEGSDESNIRALAKALKLVFLTHGLPTQVIALWMVPGSWNRREAGSSDTYVIPAAFSLKEADYQKFVLLLEAEELVPILDERVTITVLSVVRREEG